MSSTTNPQILCITNDFGPRAGGIESFVIGLIERLPKGSVTVYTSSQDGSADFDKAWMENFGVTVLRDKSKVLLPTFRVGKAVRKLIHEKEIKRVFFGAAAPLGLLAPTLRRSGVTQIVALTHGHEVWWAKVFPFNLALRRVAKYVDHLTFLGDFTKREISRSISSNARLKMVRVAPGIDTEHFAPNSNSVALKKELGLVDSKVIVSVGRLVHRKGQDFLIKSLPQIRKSIPNVHLLIVGSGPYESHLRKLVRDLKLENTVTFVGRVQFEHLPRYICIGDVFAMPSRSRLGGLEVEGLGIVYLEASSCGVPVIAGQSGGAPDAVVEGQTGFAVNGTDVFQISEAIVKVLSNEALARELGRKGRQWIVENWRWEIWASEFSTLLKLDRPL